MAAYGAATSLRNTIQRILQSSRISLVPPSPQILEPAYEAMCRLLKVLLKLDNTRCSKIRTGVNALDELIKEAVWEFEDILESHLTDQILPQLESSSGGDLSFSVDLQSLRHYVDCFIEMLRMMEVEYNIEVVNMPEEEGEPVSSRIDFGGINSKMVGLADEFEQAQNHLLAETEDNCYSLVGMAGVGKTTLAKKLFDDPSIQRHFEFRAWVKVGRKCEFKETLRCVLAQVDLNAYDHMLTEGEDDDEEKLVVLLEERFKGKKCFIVLDDVWDTRVMNYLPYMNVQILLTSRQRMIESPGQVVRFLNVQESKELLGEKVFGEAGFPLYLEELGEKIAKKCEGLPLMIVTVAELLSEADKTAEYWTKVAKKHSLLFMDAYNQISKVLFPTYDYLTQHLKMFFLYMGASPRHGDICPHDLIHRLSAEELLEPIGEQTFFDFLIKCLRDLTKWYHLVIYASNPGSWFSSEELHVHSCWQHLCKKEACKIKFLHVLQSCYDVIKDQRRLCAHCNTLFCFRQVYDSIKNDCASTIRSLLCLGPYHKYPVPIHAMGFKLLRVLDAFAVRFYHFPLETLQLICLHYLALTCNKDLPASISKLFHLQVLIIGRHMNIKKRGAQSYMPVEIWDMQELKRIQVWGSDLPTPNSNATLNKLSELLGVSVKSCTREILKRIPNIKSLAIEVELKPYDDDDSNPLSDLGYISEELQNLELLNYCVLNPELKYQMSTCTPMIPLSMFPSSLVTLYLSGFGCPWKYMNDIGSLLPNLEDLTLKRYAFQGPEWDIELGCFLKLETLVIEDTNLVRWRPQRGSLPNLELLSIRHCYKLQQLDWKCDHSFITTIELVECNPSAITSAKQLRPASLFKVKAHSSF